MSSKSRLVCFTHRAFIGAVLGILVLSACASKGSPASGTGGSSGGSTGHGGSGGTSATGGTSSASGGSGGTTSASGGSGGTTSTGGSTSAGGSTSSGGVTSAGGTAGNGPSSSGGANSGGVGGAGSGGATINNDASASGGASGGSSVGTGGNVGGAGGKDGGPGAGGGPGTGGGSGTGGVTATGGVTGTGGSSSCAGRAISLGANGTGSDSDSAKAHIEIDMKTDLPIANTKRTIEFWAFIKTTDWVGEKNQIYYYGGSASNGSFGLDFGTNNVTGSTTNHATLNPFTGSDIRDDSGKDLGITSSADQWVHIAMTWDGTVLTTYVNGLAKITAQGTGSATTLNTAQSVLMIGYNPTNNNCFNGYFDEFRVWNVARSATEIKDNYNKPLVGNEAGLVGYWKFDEASGTTVADAVTATGHTAHPGTLTADTSAHNPTFVTPATPLPLVCP